MNSQGAQCRLGEGHDGCENDKFCIQNEELCIENGEFAAFVQQLWPLLVPYLAKNGGPIVMLQLENENGRAFIHHLALHSTCLQHQFASFHLFAASVCFIRTFLLYHYYICRRRPHRSVRAVRGNAGPLLELRK